MRLFGKKYYEDTPTPLRDGRGRPKRSDAFKNELRRSASNLSLISDESKHRTRRKDSVEDGTSQPNKPGRRPGGLGDRPRLSDAFKDELRMSVQNITLIKKEKKKQKGLFRFLKRSGSGSADNEEASVISRERERKTLPLPGSFDSGDSVENSRGSRNPSTSGRQSVQVVSLSPDLRSPSRKSPRRKISKEEAEELRKSFHAANNHQDGHRLRRKTEEGAGIPPSEYRRPALRKELVDELQKSVHDRGARYRRPALGKELVDELKKSVHDRGAKYRRPALGKELVDELKKSVHDRGAKYRRPALGKELVDELQKSVHDRGAKKLNLRQQIIKRIMKRSDDSAQTTESRRDSPGIPEQPKRSGRAEKFERSEASMSFANDDSIPSLYERRVDESKAVGDGRQRDRGKEKRQTRSDIEGKLRGLPSRTGDIPEQPKRSGRAEKFERSEASMSFANDGSIPSLYERRVDESKSVGDGRQIDRGKEKRQTHSEIKGKLRGLPSRTGKRLAQSTHSTDTFVASFSDDAGAFNGVKSATYSRKEPKDDSPSRDSSSDRDYGRRRGRHTDNNVEIDISSDEAAEIEAADFDIFKIEWARLIREKKELKRSLKGSQKEMATMSSENDIFRNDNSDLRQRLSDASNKVAKLSRRQSKERSQFNNSTDLIAQARVDLAKALNEGRALKAEINNVEEFATGKDRRITVLTDLVKGQSEKIDELASKLRDTETEMHFNEDEKRRVEDELAVLVASRDGHDVSETIRQLEHEKARWLDERERALEAKRLALDEENDRLLERDRNRYRNDADVLMAASEKTREHEKEDQELQKQINQHCRDMQDANRVMQERINAEHLERTVEIKEKDHAVALLEQQVSKLKKKIVSRASDEKEKELQRAEAEATKDDLKDALKHNGILERQITTMESKMKDLTEQKDDWQEIVLPGHRNLRGVTFGASQSESLAGFLTILVEEQSILNKGRSSRKSDLTKHLKERDSEKKRKKKKKSKDERKSRKTSRSSSSRRHNSRSKSRGRSRSKSKVREKSDLTKHLKERDSKKKRKKKKSKDDESKSRKTSRSSSSRRHSSRSKSRGRSRSKSKAREKSDLTKYLKKRDSKKKSKKKSDESKSRVTSISSSSRRHSSRSKSRGRSRSNSKTRDKSSLDRISKILMRSKEDQKRKSKHEKSRSSSRDKHDKVKQSRGRKSEANHKSDKKHSRSKHKTGMSLGHTVSMLKKEKHRRDSKADMSSMVAVKVSKKKKSKRISRSMVAVKASKKKKKKKSKRRSRSRSGTEVSSLEAPSILLRRSRSDDESLESRSVLLQ